LPIADWKNKKQTANSNKQMTIEMNLKMLNSVDLVDLQIWKICKLGNQEIRKFGRFENLVSSTLWEPVQKT
jgi:hypothetical protein